MELSLKRQNVEIQSIFLQRLTSLNAAQHTNLSLRCWNASKPHNTFELWFIIVLAGVMAAMCDVVSVAAKTRGVQVLMHESFLLYFLDNSGEQHCASGRAPRGGSGCAEEHLWYGLPQGGQARTCASQWHVRPSRLLQQYVSTSSRCFSCPLMPLCCHKQWAEKWTSLFMWNVWCRVRLI